FSTARPRSSRSRSSRAGSESAASSARGRRQGAFPPLAYDLPRPVRLPARPSLRFLDAPVDGDGLPELAAILAGLGLVGARRRHRPGVAAVGIAPRRDGA